MIVLAVQVERQILLAFQKSISLSIFRVCIALAMALIGAVIIDQIILAKDIEKQKLLNIDDEVNKVFPGKSEILKNLIREIDLTIISKEQERKSISDDLQKNPFLWTIEARTTLDSVGHSTTIYIKKQIPNTKGPLIDGLDRNILQHRLEKNKKDSLLLGIRPAIEAELKLNVGFLDELKIMSKLLSESGVSLVTWFVWFFFLLGIECLIVVSKALDGPTDYELLMNELMQLHFRKVELLKSTP